jgi:metal-dependent HD superfamily phosphatase/phosphodiesterase
MITLERVKKNPQILQFIEKTEKVLKALSYTDHGLRHSNVVSERAAAISKDLGLSEKEQQLSAIAAFCHDMGNFVGRYFHNYAGALLFHQVFQNDMDPDDLTTTMQAISFHDERVRELALTSPVSAVVILADKSDVHRSRVIEAKMKDIKADIHDRVNYAVTSSDLKVDKRKKRIILTLKIDTKFVPAIEYFEIFTDRMVLCRRAAEYLGYGFGLVINDFVLL